MKKFLLFALVLVMVLAISSPVYAAPIPAGAISISAEIVDYVSALAGVAKPVNTAHYENERVAILVKVTVPTWYDTTNMNFTVDCVGLSIDSAIPGTVATGNYLIFGTLYSTTAKFTITAQDNALASATSAQALWAALYGDRTVSATVSFGMVVPATINTVNVPIAQVAGVPATGDKFSTVGGCLLMLSIVSAAWVIYERTTRRAK